MNYKKKKKKKQQFFLIIKKNYILLCKHLTKLFQFYIFQSNYCNSIIINHI